jgi:hypothetical protein
MADARILSLIVRTSEKTVGDTYRSHLSGVDTESQLAELLCEISLIDALGSVSSIPPVLRPGTEIDTECDVKVVIDGHILFGESKRLADPGIDGTRSIAKSPSKSKPPGAARPRAMDLFSKLKDVPRQFPNGALNVLFLFHPSFGETQMYIQQALFGDTSAFEKLDDLSLRDDGLFALTDWQKVSACAQARVNVDGKISIVQIWKNPNANISVPDSVSNRLKIIE